jgi:hypothetical protein
LLRAFIVFLTFTIVFGGTVASAETAAFTAKEESFIEDLGTQVDTLGDALDDFSELMSHAGDDPYLMFDEDWISDVAVQVIIIQGVNEEALELKPTPRLRHIYVFWIEATGLFDLAMDDVVEFVDEADTDAAARGAERMSLASEIMTEATDAIYDVAEDPDVVFKRAKRVKSPVNSCEVFSTYEIAQVYYGGHLKEQATIDPNDDGRACEIHFDRDFL